MRDARIAFDVYHGGREGISTQNAEYYGWSQTYTHINGITEMSNLRNSIISSVKRGGLNLRTYGKEKIYCSCDIFFDGNFVCHSTVSPSFWCIYLSL